LEVIIKKYNIIYADPPWTYKEDHTTNKRSTQKFKVQSKRWLDNLPISSITDKDCALFLWMTMPMLNVCWDLIENWGFKYKTVAFTWVKKNKIKQNYFWGMGRWTRANAELCLLCTKDKPKRISASVHSIIDTPIGKHSQKPTEIRERIVKLLGDIPRIELFAREKVVGWDCWGDEIKSDIQLEHNNGA
jgi:N6-adenosine-specific RNA methylase IME4